VQNEQGGHFHTALEMTIVKYHQQRNHDIMTFCLINFCGSIINIHFVIGTETEENWRERINVDNLLRLIGLGMQHAARGTASQISLRLPRIQPIFSNR
jgi:hypothetical protein